MLLSTAPVGARNGVNTVAGVTRPATKRSANSVFDLIGRSRATGLPSSVTSRDSGFDAGQDAERVLAQLADGYLLHSSTLLAPD
jgi:hypothetical protein